MHSDAQAIVRLVQLQAHMLREIATGLERSAELEDMYAEQRRELEIALIPYRLGPPFPFPTLAAWVAECRLRHATASSRVAAVEGLVETFCRHLEGASPVVPVDQAALHG